MPDGSVSNLGSRDFVVKRMPDPVPKWNFKTPSDSKISMKDLDKGFTIYKQMGESENRKEEADRLKQLHHSIYC